MLDTQPKTDYHKYAHRNILLVYSLSVRIHIEIRMQNMRLMHCYYNYQTNEIRMQPLNLCKKYLIFTSVSLLLCGYFVKYAFMLEYVRMISLCALKCSTKHMTDERTAFFMRQANHKILKL